MMVMKSGWSFAQQKPKLIFNITNLHRCYATYSYYEPSNIENVPSTITQPTSQSTILPRSASAHPSPNSTNFPSNSSSLSSSSQPPLSTSPSSSLPSTPLPSRTNPLLESTMRALENRLYIKQMQDWYEVPLVLVKEFGGSHLLKQYRKMKDLLSDAYPSHSWPHILTCPRGVRQNFMQRVVQHLFPDDTVVKNCRTSGLVSENGHPMEIDCYLPKYRLGFEFQEQHHYFHGGLAQSMSLADIQERDKKKMSQAEKLDITLIRVPFWWDFRGESLIATIKQYRSDLFSDIPFEPSKAISPDNIPDYILDIYNTEIPDYGALMLPMQLPTSHAFDPTDWWICEKYDGLRAMWHPEKKQFFSRKGKQLFLPDWLRESMPDLPLDGEFWFGRGTLNTALKISGRVAFSEMPWDTFTYLVYDVVDHNALKSVIPPAHPHIRVVKYDQCTGRAMVARVIEEMVQKGGEGVVLRNPETKYVGGFTRNMYKFRITKASAAMLIEKKGDRTWLCLMYVILHKEPGKTGELQDCYQTELMVEEGLEGKDSLKENDIVLYKYYSYAMGGTPTNPMIFCVDRNLSWDYVMSERQRQITTRPTVLFKSSVSWARKESRRAFFDEFARDKGFDPLIMTRWYGVLQKDILKRKGGSRVLTYHKNSLSVALMELFPKLNWDPKRFKRVDHPDSFLYEKNRKNFFVELLKDKGIDVANIGDTEISLSIKDVQSKKGGNAVLAHYRGSLTEALKRLFPKARLKTTKNPMGFWMDVKNHKEFFDTFASKNNLDPLVAKNWYSVSQQDVATAEDGKTVLKQYNNSLYQALMGVYPDIGLKVEGFDKFPVNHWKDPKNRKLFFDNFAADRKFDPLKPSSWYGVTQKDVLEQKGGSRMLTYYEGSFTKALLAVYPAIGLKLDSFGRAPPNYWTSPDNCRKLFVDYAETMEFDYKNPDNWYPVTLAQLTKFNKGVAGAIRQYKNSHIQALLSLFPDIGLLPEKFNKRHTFV